MIPMWMVPNREMRAFNDADEKCALLSHESHTVQEQRHPTTKSDSHMNHFWEAKKNIGAVLCSEIPHEFRGYMLRTKLSVSLNNRAEII